MALRLLVDLYHAQNLLDDGGIARHITYQRFERVKLGERGVFVVWGFKLDLMYVCSGSPIVDVHRREKLSQEELDAKKNKSVDWFARMDLLERVGAVEWMPHVCESDAPDAELIHPYGLNQRDQKRVEVRICHAAHQAGCNLLFEKQHESAQGLWLVPVPAHMTKATLVGIARLRIHPRTRRTREWLAELHATGERWVERYESIAAGRTDTVAIPA
jgi:hypothetical protein